LSAGARVEVAGLSLEPFSVVWRGRLRWGFDAGHSVYLLLTHPEPPPGTDLLARMRSGMTWSFACVRGGFFDPLGDPDKEDEEDELCELYDTVVLLRRQVRVRGLAEEAVRAILANPHTLAAVRLAIGSGA